MEVMGVDLIYVVPALLVLLALLHQIMTKTPKFELHGYQIDFLRVIPASPRASFANTAR